MPQDSSASDVIAKVSLVFFKAQPENIGPFGTSTLSWSVKTPTVTDPDVQIMLDSELVEADGQEPVQPVSAQTYKLIAVYRGSSKLLGTVTVTVDHTGCQIQEIAPLDRLLPPLIEQGLEQQREQHQTEAYSRAKPQVITTPGVIRIKWQLGYPVKHIPDPEIDMDLSFGLTVVQFFGMVTPLFAHRRLASVNENIHVDVNVAPWLWLIPGAMIGLSIALDNAREKATSAARGLIDGVVGFFNSYPESTALAALEFQSVTISPGLGNAGVVQALKCPPQRTVAVP